MKPAALFFLLFLYTAALCAQQTRWSAGANTFLGLSKFTYGDPVAEYLNKFAFRLSGIGQYNTKGRAAFRLGLGYSYAQGGYRGETPGIPFPGLPPMNGDMFEKHYEQSDLLLPVEMLIDFGKRDHKGLYLLFGTSLDFALQRKARSITYLTGEPQDSGLQKVSNYRKVDLLGTLGLGYVLEWGSGYRFFVQPEISSNIPGNVLHFLSQKKGGQSNYKTVYWYGVCLGALRMF